MKVSTQITTSKTIDNSKLVYNAIKTLTQYEVKIGLPKEYAERESVASDEARRGGVFLTNAEIAFINEYGEPGLNIPARPFLVPGIYKVMPQIIRLIGPAIREILSKQDPRDSLIKVGRTGRNGVRDFLLFGSIQPLAHATIQYRKDAGIDHNTPLIETGRMRNALSYMIDFEGQRVFISDKIREKVPVDGKNLMRKVGRNIIP